MPLYRIESILILSGYQSYLSWVKQQVINGNTVAIAVLIQDESIPAISTITR